MIALADIADNLELSDEGVWVSPARQAVSYPDDARSWLARLEEESWWFRHRSAGICAAVRAFPPTGEIFDVGGGNGVVSVALEAAGFPAVLLEPGVEGAANGRRRGLDRVVCSTLQEAGFHPEVLPAVGMFDVIEHVEDDVGFLRELRRCLVPGGRLYLTVPAHPGLWSAEDEYAGHHRRYDRGALLELLERGGFSPEYVTFLFALLPLPIWLLRRAGGTRDPSDSPERLQQQLGDQPKLLTAALGLVARAEAGFVARRIPIPFGASLLAVARRA